MSDNRSARIVNGIPETQSLDFSRPISLKADKTIVKSLVLTAAQLKGIDRINVVCCNMAYTRASFTHVIDLAYLPAGTGINFTNGSPNDQAGLEQIHESIMTATKATTGDVTLNWSRSQYLNIAADTYTTTTASSGYGIVSVFGYQSFNLVDTYLKSEIDTLFKNRYAVNEVVEIVGVQTPTQLGYSGTWLCISSSYAGPTGANGHIVASRNGAIPVGFATTFAQASITGSNIGFWAFKIAEVTTYPNSGWYGIAQASVFPATTLTLTAYNLTRAAACTAQLYTDGVVIVDKQLCGSGDVIISGSGPGVTPYANETNRWKRTA